MNDKKSEAYEKCKDCTTPAGTRCESAVSGCPYRAKPKEKDKPS